MCSQRLAENILRQEYNKFSNQEVEDLRYVIEAEIKLYTEYKSIVGIKTPLDTVFIASQDDQKDN